MVVANWPGGTSFVYTNTGKYSLVAPASTLITLSATSSTGDVAQPEQQMTGVQGTELIAGNLVACNGGLNELHLDITGHGYLGVAAISPDGNTLAVFDSNANDMYCYSTKTGAILSTFKDVFQYYRIYHWNGANVQPRITFSNDGSKVLATENYYGTSIVRVVNVAGGAVTDSAIWGYSACFTQDGSGLYISDRGGISLYDLATQKVVKTVLSASGSVAVGLRNSGSQLVYLATTRNGNISSTDIVLWDLTTNQSVARYPLSTVSSFDSVSSFDPVLASDGNTLGLESGGKLVFIDLRNGTAINTSDIPLPSNAFFQIAPNNAGFIACLGTGAANVVGMYSLTDGVAKHIFPAPAGAGQAFSAGISPSGKLATGTYLNTIRIWDVK
jgi:WD40 repeat protein